MDRGSGGPAGTEEEPIHREGPPLPPWLGEALGGAPEAVRKVAIALLLQRSHPEGRGAADAAHPPAPLGPPLALAAGATRLAAAGLGVASLASGPAAGARPPEAAAVAARRALEAAVAALGPKGEGAEALAADEGAGVAAAVAEVAHQASLALAVVHLQVGRHGDAIAMLQGTAEQQRSTSQAAPLAPWLAHCVAHALQHRRAGHAAPALVALELAADALQRAPEAAGCGPVEGPWLARQAAACRLALGDGAAAAAAAELAAKAEVSSRGAASAASLRLAVRARCLGGAAGPAGSAVDLALAYSSHQNVSVRDALCAGHELVHHKLVQAAAALCGALRQRLAGCAAGGPEQQLAVAVHRLELLAAAVQAEELASSPGGVSLAPLLQVQVPPELVAAGANLAAWVAAHAWNLACRAVRGGRADLALAWLRSLRECAAGEQEPRVLSAEALCHWWSGGLHEAAACAEAVLAKEPSNECALATLLVLSAGQPQLDHVVEARAANIAAMGAPAAALVLRCVAAGSRPPGAPLFRALVRNAALRGGSLDCMAQEERMAAFARLAGALCGGAGAGPAGGGAGAAAEEAAAAFGPGEEEALEAVATLGSPSLPLELQRVAFECLWDAALALGRRGRLAACASAFDRAHRLAAAAAAAAAEQELGGAAGLLRCAEEAQMCLVAHMAAVLQCARRFARAPGAERARSAQGDGQAEDAAALYTRVAEAAGPARAACERTRGLRKQLRPGDAGAPDKALPLVVLMEFEARCALRDASLGAYVEAAASSGAAPTRCFLTMAQLALTAGNREAALQSLRFYLRLAADSAARGPGESAAQFAVALRELVALHTSRNESVGCFEEALSVLRRAPWFAQAYPPAELQWLCAVSWASSAHNHKEGQHDWAQRWAAASLGVLAFCPALAGHRRQMLEAHAFCTQRQQAAAAGA